MLITSVPIVVTPEDKARAAFIRTSEEEARGKPRTPMFMRDGLGRCRKVGNPDDFTNRDYRIEGRRARERARAVCNECPFAKECLAFNMETDGTGIFGGQWLIAGVPQARP